MLTRRLFVTGGLIAAPAVVLASNIMPIHKGFWTSLFGESASQEEVLAELMRDSVSTILSDFPKTLKNFTWQYDPDPIPLSFSSPCNRQRFSRTAERRRWQEQNAIQIRMKYAEARPFKGHRDLSVPEPRWEGFPSLAVHV
jgi:hypothetical protein